MPEISFRLYYPEAFAAKFCGKFNVSFTIQFKKETNVKERDRDDLVTISPSVIWPYYEVHLNDFVPIDFKGVMQGGRALIEVRKYLDNTLIKSFNFTIKGQNPLQGEVMQFANSKYSNVWFMKKLIMHESSTLKIDAGLEMEHFNPHNSSHEKLYKTRDAYSRCPKASNNGDGGFGLMQLTNPIPSSNALWDWKQNIKEGYDILISKIDEKVKPKLLPELNAVKNWNILPDNSNNKVKKISLTYGGITWKIGASSIFDNGSTTINNYFNETLGTNERSFLDACLLLAYNGYKGTGNKNFLKLIVPSGETEKPYWTTQDNTNNYVKEISE